jgi:regulator of sirC expression with transglutaminase-like and TPR domain
VADARDARRALEELVGGDEIDLARAALLVAAEEYAGLDTAHYLAELDRLASAVRQQLVGEVAADRQIAGLNALLFGEEGFRGNGTHYYDPRNSYLNEVLDRRLGIPITLSLIYVEVGQRAGIPLCGVGLPAHFIVAYDAPQPARLLIDPFNCGRMLSLADCEQMLQQAHGGSMRLQPAHLAPSAPRDVLVRLLTNLKLAYQRQGDLVRALRSSEQISVVSASPHELRERGMLRFRLADFPGAEVDLLRYLEFEPDAPDADAVRKQLELIRELHARRN